MDDEDQKPGINQVPLMHDMVYDSSLPLKPPKRKAARPKKPANYSPDYDPDTIDLFGDLPSIEMGPGDTLPADEQSTDETFNEIAEDHDEQATELFTEHEDQQLRSELTDQLSEILEDLGDHQKNA